MPSHRSPELRPARRRTPALAAALTLLGVAVLSAPPLVAGATSSSGTIPPPVSATCTEPSSGIVECPLPLNLAVPAYTLSTLILSAEKLDSSITADTPMVISAWGGQGGQGWSQISTIHGGSGGTQGYAQTETTLNAYKAAYGSAVLYYFLGMAGNSNVASKTVYGGLGGVSTITGPVDLWTGAAPCIAGYSSCATSNILADAGGSGAGGEAGDSASGGGGGAGGSATATLAGSTTGAGQKGAGSTSEGKGGDGGSDGSGGSGGNGGAGINNHGGGSGNAGIGGLGGAEHDIQGPTPVDEWGNVGLISSIGTDGQGGEGEYRGTPPDVGAGGAGGGGFGGGGGGGGGGNTYAGGGGGGGGSFALQSLADATGLPTFSPASSAGGVTVTWAVQSDQLAFTQQPTDVAQGATMAPAPSVQLESASGAALDQAGTAVTLSEANGVDGTTELGTATTDATGLATFPSVSIDQVGGLQLVASATGANPAVSDTFTAYPASGWDLSFTQQPSNASAGEPISPAVTVQLTNGSGGDYDAANVPIALSFSATPKVIASTNSTGASGDATFPALLTKNAGTFTLSASAPGATAATSSSFTVSALSATKIVITQQPSSVEEGQKMTPAVTSQLEDSLGNKVSQAGVDICLDPSPNATTSDGCVETGSSGSATATNFEVFTAGTFTLTPTSHSITGQKASDSFTVSTGSPDKLAITKGIIGTYAGEQLTADVQVENGSGASVSDDGVPVVLYLDTSQYGWLPWSYGTTGTGGSVSIPFRIYAEGSYQVKAEAADLAPATSNQFTIIPNTQLTERAEFSVEPSDVTAGTTMSPAPTVQVTDLFGNSIEQSGKSVSLTTTSGLSLGSATTDSAGLATFSSVSITTSGTFLLVATPMDGTPGISDPFTVSAASSTSSSTSSNSTTSSTSTTSTTSTTSG